MVLTSLAGIQSTFVSTPWGLERGLSYLGQNFVGSKIYGSINEAIAAIKQDLDGGLFSLVVPEGDAFRVWYLLSA